MCRREPSRGLVSPVPRTSTRQTAAPPPSHSAIGLRPPAQEGLLALLGHPQHHGGTRPRPGRRDQQQHGDDDAPLDLQHDALDRRVLRGLFLVPPDLRIGRGLHVAQEPPPVLGGAVAVALPGSARPAAGAPRTPAGPPPPPPARGAASAGTPGSRPASSTAAHPPPAACCTPRGSACRTSAPGSGRSCCGGAGRCCCSGSSPAAYPSGCRGPRRPPGGRGRRRSRRSSGAAATPGRAPGPRRTRGRRSAAAGPRSRRSPSGRTRPAPRAAGSGSIPSSRRRTSRSPERGRRGRRTRAAARRS